MASNGKRNRRPEPYTSGKNCPQQLGDEAVGEYSREQLIRMNDRFIERVERASENGSEHRQSGSGIASRSAATNGANATRPR
jgi:hypothetical protein